MTNTNHRRTRLRRGLAVAAVTAVTALSVPTGGAQAVPVKSDDGGVGFSGFSSLTYATPIKVEIFEPTIPIPATPQAEFDMGYTKVKADSSSSSGRASYFWPGDVIGEGLGPLMQQLGVPQDVITALFGDGSYPVQVNSGYPSGEASASNEQIPGMVQRTKSGQYQTFAKIGFSDDCDVQDPDDSNTSGGLIGNLPVIGGDNGLLSGLLGIGSSPSPSPSPSASSDGDGEDSGADDTTCPTPTLLSTIVDAGGYVASSNVKSNVGVGGEVSAESRAALGDVSLLGGLITMSGINAKAIVSADGPKPKADGVASYGEMSVAGQKFRFGPDGIEAAGKPQSIPGLSNNPEIALQQLGVTISAPGRSTERQDNQVTTVTEALKVTIDTAVLQPVLQTLPLKQLLSTVLDPIPFPDEAGIIKSLLLAVPDLAPKIVLHLGYAQSTVQTVQGLSGPTTPGTPTDGQGGGTTGGSGGSSGGSGDTGAPAGGDVPGGDSGAPGTGGDAPTTSTLENTSGLPPLFSIPSALLFGGLIGAAVIGTYFRRLGLAALGGGVACSHGLESGVPDLRKI